jgi:hypothetical protein
MKSLVFALLASILLFSLASGAPLSAFQAQAIAEKSLPAHARGRIIRVEGLRSSTSVTPITWRFLIFDEKAEQQGRRVTVSGNVATDLVEGYVEPWRFRLAAYKADEVIPPSRLKIDSTQALHILTKSPVMAGIKLSTVTFVLSKGKGNVEPFWTLRVLADNKGYEADLGSARISAESGRILEIKIDTKKLKS